MRKVTTSRASEAILKSRRIREKMLVLEAMRQHEQAVLLNEMVVVDHAEAERCAREKAFRKVCQSRDCSML